jgi:hypothetical protein
MKNGDYPEFQDKDVKNQSWSEIFLRNESENIDFYIVEQFNVKDVENVKKCNLKWLFDYICNKE